MSVEIYIDWAGSTHLAGRLHESSRGTAASFVYASTWLERDDAFAIDPISLPLRGAPIHGPALFGALQDSGPDRWGRVLIDRAVEKGVLRARPYSDINYILSISDKVRVGALRFRRDDSTPFLAQSPAAAPSLDRLPALLHAADAVGDKSASASDLRLLLGEGAPVGGARPKVSVSLPDGRLAIAKFPKYSDTRDIAAGEILALTIAKEAGLTVAEHRIVSVSGRHVSVITRFDRDRGQRIPFISAATILGISCSEAGAYTMIADAIRRFGHNIEGDLRELWGRLVFSLLVNNQDDHLRNHGFLMLSPGRWALSPAYDLNPVPKNERTAARKTAITEDQRQSTIEEAMAAAPHFGLTPIEARDILFGIHGAVSRWRDTGKRLRFRSDTLADYVSAFDNPHMSEAARILTRRTEVGRTTRETEERVSEQPSREVWEIASWSGEQAKPLVEKRSGPAGSREDIAAKLGLNVQTVQNMERRGELIAYPALHGEGQRYPLWQLTAADSRSVVNPWVQPLLEAYGHNGWGLLDFLTAPRATHSDLNYLALLTRDETSVQEVLRAARRTNAE